jgi:hypothetical protein
MRKYRVRAIISQITRETVVQAFTFADARALARSMFPTATAIWVDEIR